MKKLTILLLPLSLMAASFPLDFKQEAREALDFIYQHQSEIKQAEAQFDLPWEKAMAVVAPELLRYNLFRDLLETTALELAYVKYGSEVADFSIGPFQMKPSFAEAVEQYVITNPELLACHADAVLYLPLAPKYIRKARLKRLETLEGQLQYAFLYSLMMEQTYPNTAFPTNTDQLRLWATAYNCGFTRSYDDLMQRMDRPIFPYGADFDIPQYSYAEWASLFYRKLQQRP